MYTDTMIMRAHTTIMKKSEEIIFNISYEAAKFWTQCPSDFCVQHVTETCIVFGGTNRVIWRPETGFYADKSYCTQEFLNHFEKENRR